MASSAAAISNGAATTNSYDDRLTQPVDSHRSIWHTVNRAVISYGTALVDHPDRIGYVTALGLDETLFGKRGRYRTKTWSTSIVDVRAGRLLDVVEGRAAAPACAWLAQRGPA